MIRRVNHTGRKQILSRHVDIALAAVGHKRTTFTLTLDLKELELPTGSPIFVEALRHTAFSRHPFGQTGVLRKGPAELPPEMGDGDGVRFRVKVVEAASQAKGVPPRLLALGVFHPRLPHPSKGKSLLPVDWGDFNDQVWDLQIDEQGGPVLRISRHLVSDFQLLVKSSEFITLALPSVFRQLLTHIVVIQGVHSSEGDHWTAPWLRLAGRWNGQGDPPNPKDSADETDEWIDDAVKAFSRRAKVAGRFTNWWKGA